jgi:integrase
MARKTASQKGRLFKRGKKGSFYIQFYVNGKQIVKRLSDDHGNAITTEPEAKKARDKVIAPYLARDEVQLRQQAVNALTAAEELEAIAREATKPKTPIAEMWDKHPWTVNTRGNTERTLSDNTIKDNASQWARFTDWATENEMEFAEAVTQEQAMAFLGSLKAAGLSGDRINKIVMCCRVMFDLSKINPNPFSGLKKQHHKAKGRRELTIEELAKVCGNATGELRTLLAIGLYTGLRLGDACCLEWSEINTDLTRITREPSKTSWKSDSELVIPIHEVLRAILEETPKGKRKGYVLPDTANQYEREKGAVSKRIQKHFTDNKIRVHKAGTGYVKRKQKDGKYKLVHTGKRAVVEVGFHSLRHSFVSLCAREGVPLHVVRSLCGHSSPQVQRLYLHHSTEDAEQAIAVLPSIAGPNRDTEQSRRAIVEKAAKLIKSTPLDKLKQAIAIMEG